MLLKLYNCILPILTMTKIITLALLFMSLNSYSQTPVFYGGLGGGVVSSCYQQSEYLGLSVFFGGEDDGFTEDCKTQKNYVSFFYGGNGEGSTVNCYEEDLLVVFGVFTGGSGGGFSHSCYLQSPLLGNNIYLGGKNDGFSVNCFEQSPFFGFKLFNGGNDDGNVLNCFIQDIPIGANLFNGGSGDGFIVYCFEQDLTLISGVFTGGNGGGYVASCELQEDYLVELPIELTTFEAIAIDDERKVKLIWETQSEINNNYFIIERSSDLFEWEYVAEVDGAGNSSQLIQYLSYDIDPYSNLSYYRLKQVDFDGNFTYSFIKSVYLGSEGKFSNELLIYPNPATSLLNFQFNEFYQDELSILIYDMSGKVILVKDILLEKGKGLYSITDLSMFNSGTYFIIISDGNKTIVNHKVIIN